MPHVVLVLGSPSARSPARYSGQGANAARPSPRTIDQSRRTSYLKELAERPQSQLARTQKAHERTRKFLVLDDRSRLLAQCDSELRSARDAHGDWRRGLRRSGTYVVAIQQHADYRGQDVGVQKAFKDTPSALSLVTLTETKFSGRTTTAQRANSRQSEFDHRT
jgi:hypothetical protein